MKTKYNSKKGIDLEFSRKNAFTFWTIANRNSVEKFRGIYLDSHEAATECIELNSNHSEDPYRVVFCYGHSAEYDFKFQELK